MSGSLSLHAQIERWPLAQAFAISRGAKTEAVVVTVSISDGVYQGRGECVPYARYQETPDSVIAQIEAIKPLLHQLDRHLLQTAMPPGAARNALDCAFWDLEAKRSGKSIDQLAGVSALQALTTAFTISLDTPDAMARAAIKAAAWPLLKIKLGREGDAERLHAVRQAAPKAELTVDANEGWNVGNLAENLSACAAIGVTLIEQPLPEKDDATLAAIPHPIPLCADESAHGLLSLTSLQGKYEAVNIKLDKAGGLTEALAMAEQASHMKFSIMAGCMVATSLAIAPALYFAQKAKWVDLDGPLWLAKDRPHALRYDDHRVYPPDAALWG